ncbi:MAG: hypothetical protein VKI63_05985 [Cyanobium sp.]|nr:hypothetical protein [Cyanobium sp.]
MNDPLSNPGRKLPLAPPARFVAGARQAMGGIDFDPWTTRTNNRLVLATRFLDRELIVDPTIACNDPWDIPEAGRVLCVTPAGMIHTRRFLARILKEYRRGTVKQACVLVGTGEAATKIPWLWDLPIAMPFTRLGFRWYDDECEKFRTSQPTHWSFVVFFPPTATPEAAQAGLVRFHDAFAPFSRIIVNEFAGDTSWKQHYKQYFGREFQESR